MGTPRGTCPTPCVPRASACSLRPAPSPPPTRTRAVPPPVPTSSLPAVPRPPARSRQHPGTLCTVTPAAPLGCHPNPTAQHAPSLATNPLRNPQPGEEIPPTPSLPFCQIQESILPFGFFFFSMLSATLDEQSPPLRLPSLTHVVIRSCRYTAVICLVSAFAQTRLANRCGLQLHSLGRAPLHAVTGLPRAAASHFPTLADGGAAGWHMLVLSLPQCSAGWIPSQAFSGFSCLQGRGSGRSKPRGK